MLKSVFVQQDCRAITFELSRLSCTVSNHARIHAISYTFISSIYTFYSWRLISPLWRRRANTEIVRPVCMGYNS